MRSQSPLPPPAKKTKAIDTREHTIKLKRIFTLIQTGTIAGFVKTKSIDPEAERQIEENLAILRANINRMLPDEAGYYGYTPLMWAAKHFENTLLTPSSSTKDDFIAIFNLLITNGARVDFIVPEKDESGKKCNLAGDDVFAIAIRYANSEFLKLFIPEKSQLETELATLATKSVMTAAPWGRYKNCTRQSIFAEEKTQSGKSKEDIGSTFAILRKYKKLSQKKRILQPVTPSAAADDNKYISSQSIATATSSSSSNKTVPDLFQKMQACKDAKDFLAFLHTHQKSINEIINPAHCSLPSLEEPNSTATSAAPLPLPPLSWTQNTYDPPQHQH